MYISIQRNCEHKINYIQLDESQLQQSYELATQLALFDE